MNDVQQFNYKKAEFEKYRNEELNKIKAEKKRLFIENKNINNIKFQNQSYSMIIKKDKETIENLKKQILDYQHLLKQKECENKNNKIYFGKKNVNINNNKKLDDTKFDNTKKLKQEKRNHSTENIKIARFYDKNNANFFYQTYNLINVKNTIERDSNNNMEKFDINDIPEHINNFSEEYINEINKENEINEEFCNYNYKGINSNNENNEELVINIGNKKLNFEQLKNNEIDNNINNDESKMDNPDNDDIILSKKDLTSPEGFFNNINNNNVNKIKIENKIVQQKKLKNKIINDINNITSKSIGNNKKSKEKLKKDDKKIHKYNTVARITRLKKNIENNNNQTNMKMNSSNSSSTISKTLNKSCKSTISKAKNIIKSNNEEKSNNDGNNIPQKYLSSNYKLLKTLNSEGKIINIYSNNKLEVIFKSGVKKEIFEDGYQIVNFTNGDLKQIFPDGKTIYYFKESKVTQTTFNNGTQIFNFDNGQIEKHYSDGSKQISFPDGTIRYIYPNGYEETYNNKEENNEKELNLLKDELK